MKPRKTIHKLACMFGSLMIALHVLFVHGLLITKLCLTTYYGWFKLTILLILFMQVAEKTALLRPIELKLVPMALESSAFRSKFLDTDELLSYCSWLAVSTVAIEVVLKLGCY